MSVDGNVCCFFFVFFVVSDSTRRLFSFYQAGHLSFIQGLPCQFFFHRTCNFFPFCLGVFHVIIDDSCPLICVCLYMLSMCSFSCFIFSISRYVLIVCNAVRLACMWCSRGSAIKLRHPAFRPLWQGRSVNPHPDPINFIQMLRLLGLIVLDPWNEVTPVIMQLDALNLAGSYPHNYYWNVLVGSVPVYPWLYYRA